MTRHKATQTGLGTPSPLDRWINAMLRVFAMLVSHAARLCSMRLIRLSAECHSDATPEVLPCKESGKLKETTKAAGSGRDLRASASSSFVVAATDNNNNNSKAGLMVSRSRSDRPSNPSRSEGRGARGGLAALSTSHLRPCAEDLGCRSGGTLSNPHDLPTQIPGMRFRLRLSASARQVAYLRMTRGWVCAGTHGQLNS